MIGNDARFVSAFGRAVLDKTELGAVVAKAVKAGFAVVLCEPGSKRSVCTLVNPTTRARADKAAREAAKAAGVQRWDRVRHECGLKHALEDPDKAKALYAKVQAQYEEPLNLAIVTGRSRMVCVDLDTPEQLEAFGRDLTVQSPGTRDPEGNWAHHGGGHIWFELPSPVMLPDGPGKYVDPEGGWVAMWGESYALVPPSRRPEGAYTFSSGDIEVVPPFLLGKILAEPERVGGEGGPKGPGDPADEWAAGVQWETLLSEATTEENRWISTGKIDACGCPIWMAPGGRADPKSATAHEAGCPRTDTSTGHGPLHIWTDAPPKFLEGRRNVTKLQYLACRDHGGNVAAAMRAEEIASSLVIVPESVNASEEGAEAFTRIGDYEERMIQEELRKLVVREEAKRRFASWQVGDRGDPVSTPLRDLLAEPDDDPVYRIEGLWPTGGTVVFSAQQKAGKTTAVGNVVRSLADGVPFLGGGDPVSLAGALEFGVQPLEQGETVFVADLELDRRTLRRWLRDQSIGRVGAVRAESFRGRLEKFDILDEAARTKWATALRSWGVRVLIIDPLGPLLAAYGFSEDSNTEISVVLNAITTLAVEAEVSEVMVVHHMGHNGERSRGASRLRGWPDVEWRLVREGAAEGEEPGPDAARFFTAEGRDVAIPETRLEFDPTTRHLYVAGGSRTDLKRERKDQGRVDARAKVVEFIRTNPGCSQNDILKSKDTPHDKLSREVVRELVDDGVIHSHPMVSGQRGNHHFVDCDCPTPEQCERAVSA
jgi:hypothetical protein